MEPAQLQIRLFTKQEKYAVPDTPFSLASNVTCKELNTLVNELLNEANDGAFTEITFDFIIGNEFLRIPLIKHLEEFGISCEATVDIEYVERQPGPEPENCLLHDDWIAGVEVRNNWILTGCYDNSVNIWDISGNHKSTIPGHTGAVKDVAWINTSDTIATFVSVSMDQTAMLWGFDLGKNAVEFVHVCRGHENGIECIAVNPNGILMATGSWDNFLKIWSTSTEPSEADTGVLPKKSKSDQHDSSYIRTPVLTLKGHKEVISACCWLEPNEILTASWDHTVKVFDAAGGIKTDIVGRKPFLSVDYSHLNQSLITSSTDKIIRLYDLRSTEGSLVKSSFSSHNAWVQSVRWSKTNSFLFVSGAYDNEVKLWDTRSTKASLYDLKGHEDKVLCCDWSNEDFIVSGGMDNSIRIFRMKSENCIN